MIAPFLNHAYVSGAEPVALTVNVTVVPAFTVLLEGWLVIVGGARIVITAGVDTAEPAAFEIRTA